jgi:hypothetical protein
LYGGCGKDGLPVTRLGFGFEVRSNDANKIGVLFHLVQGE